MRATLLGLLSFASLAIITPEIARAQNCAAVYESAFSRIRSATRNGSQTVADQEVESLFGPRPSKCEEGAYQKFLDSFEAFAREAIRAAQPQKVGKKVIPATSISEYQLRLAIAAFKKSPLKVPAKETRVAINAYRQTRSNLSAVVEDAGGTMAMNELLAAMAQTRAPEGAEDGPPGEVVTTTTTTPTGTPSSTSPSTASPVTAIRVPTIPLPTWAVIKLYEARDAASVKDSDVAKSKLQDIIIWMESVTQAQP